MTRVWQREDKKIPYFYRTQDTRTYVSHTRISYRCWCTSFRNTVYICRDNRATCRRCVVLYACTLIRIRFIAFSMRTRVRIRCISDVSPHAHVTWIRHRIATCDVDFISFRHDQVDPRLKSILSVIYYRRDTITNTIQIYNFLVSGRLLIVW